MTKLVKGLLLVMLAALVINIAALTAFASTEGAEEARRIDTANVNSATEIKPIEEKSEGAAGHGEEAVKENPHEALKAEAGAKESESPHGEEEAEEEHHPAWMIPGWQTLFTILAVGYFALAVAVLPKIMAKEEEHH